MECLPLVIVSTWRRHLDVRYYPALGGVEMIMHALLHNPCIDILVIKGLLPTVLPKS